VHLDWPNNKRRFYEINAIFCGTPKEKILKLEETTFAVVNMPRSHMSIPSIPSSMTLRSQKKSTWAQPYTILQAALSIGHCQSSRNTGGRRKVLLRWLHEQRQLLRSTSTICEHITNHRLITMLNEVMRAEEWHGTTVSEQCCWLLLCKTKEEMWSMTPPCPFYCKNHQASIMVWYWPTVLFLKQMDLKTAARILILP